MPPSDYVAEVNSIQGSIKPQLKALGFKVRGRTFNRLTPDGLTQVVNFQMGASDPPGTTYIPGLRENFHGLFTVNLGVYIPEVSAVHGGGPAKSWVQEYHCSIRDRLGSISGAKQDFWWPASARPDVIEDVGSRLLTFGVPFLGRFSTRDQVLAELRGRGENLEYCAVPRIVSAIILVGRQDIESARQLLAAQCLETTNKRHPEYVRELAQRIGVGAIDG